jgi:hypothetical protein
LWFFMAQNYYCLGIQGRSWCFLIRIVLRVSGFALSHNGGLICTMPKLVFSQIDMFCHRTLSRSASNVMQYMYHSYFSKIERCSCWVLSTLSLLQQAIFPGTWMDLCL